MMRAPRFRYYAARSAADAAGVLADEPHALLLAGGTDVIPKLKRRQATPEWIVSLARAEELRGIAMNGELAIGAMTRLRDIANDPRVRESHHALFRAVSQIATPLIRNTATLGGNLALDTRCNYYDQNEEWRDAIGGCKKGPGASPADTAPHPASGHLLPASRGEGQQGNLACDPSALAPQRGESDRAHNSLPLAPQRGESDRAYNLLPLALQRGENDRAHNVLPLSPQGGERVALCEAQGRVRGAPESICWVAPSSARCWAVSSSDAAPALIALGARVTLLSKSGTRELPLEDLYRDDGISPLAMSHGEILTTIRVPKLWRSTYWKLRRRGSFDFPVLGVAAAIRFAPDGIVEDARVVLGAVASRPLLLDESRLLVGNRLTDESIETFAARAAAHAKPLDNTDFAMSWRKSVARTFLAGVLRELRGDDPATFPLLMREATGGIR